MKKKDVQDAVALDALEGVAETQAVIVTTEHRGVFFGYVPRGTPLTATVLRLLHARLGVYWSSDVKGFMGLGATGPTRGCRIGPRVPAITVQKITAVIECSSEAAAAWEAAPWTR